MTGALKYEWLRISTIRSSYWMAGLAVVLSAGITLLMGLTVSAAGLDVDVREVTTYVTLAGASGPIIPVMAAPFFAVIGVLSVGHEYRYGTSKATLAANPNRVAVLAAKLLVLVAWVVVSAVTFLLLSLALTWLLLDNTDFGSHMVRPMVNYVGYCTGFAAAGLGLAALLRNQTGALVAVLVWPLVVEPILYGITVVVSETSGAGVGRLSNLLPASAGRRSMFDPYESFVGLGDAAGDVWSVAAAVLVFWAGVLLVTGAGAASFLRRDA